MNYRVAFFVALAAAVVVGALSLAQITSLNAQLVDARDDSEDAEEEASESEERLGDLEDELARTQRELRAMRRAQKEAAQALTLGGSSGVREG